ncbi:hypothetical protein EJB05_54771, partial [Eragrostis curvula]
LTASLPKFRRVLAYLHSPIPRNPSLALVPSAPNPSRSQLMDGDGDGDHGIGGDDVQAEGPYHGEGGGGGGDDDAAVAALCELYDGAAERRRPRRPATYPCVLCFLASSFARTRETSWNAPPARISLAVPGRGNGTIKPATSYIKMLYEWVGVTLMLEVYEVIASCRYPDKDAATAFCDSMTDVDPSVHASFYWISSQYHMARQEFAEFCKNALLYLAYTTVESLSESFKLDLVFDLSPAATLLCDNTYNFGESLAKLIVCMSWIEHRVPRIPQVKALRDWLNAWVGKVHTTLLSVEALTSSYCKNFGWIFYKSALLYLAYTTVESLSEYFKQEMAFDISLAALLGDNIYNFGELLAHLIINSLIQTKAESVCHMLQAFYTGNLALYQELCQINSLIQTKAESVCHMLQAFYTGNLALYQELCQINSLIETKVEWVYHMLQAFNTGNLALYQELCQSAIRRQDYPIGCQHLRVGFSISSGPCCSLIPQVKGLRDWLDSCRKVSYYIAFR